MTPKKPSRINEEARACLEALSSAGLGPHISLGGAFGLAHYAEYRPTHDVDAWWQESATRDARERVIDALETALRRFGEIRTRRWGDVVSVDLMCAPGRSGFTFQIADRSARLQPSLPSPWAGVALDSFDDLIASKMAALVQRGAPRDLLDIYTVCEMGLCTPELCWTLWMRRTEAAGEAPDVHRARLAIASHLKRLDLARPLPSIADANERASAERVRSWYAKEFSNAV